MRGVIDDTERSIGVWALRTTSLPGGRFELVGMLSDHHPDGASVGPGPNPSDFPGAVELLSVRLDAERRPRVVIAPWALPDAPELWFVEDDAPTAGRSMHSVVAFASPHLPDGTLVTNAAFFTMPVRSDDQVGAVRWDVGTGEIDQIYVVPSMRGNDVARKLTMVAGAFHAHRGWPGKIHVGGRRSDEVEAMVQDRTAQRVLPRTERTVVIDPRTGAPAE
jgi:hypothetical protein